MGLGWETRLQRVCADMDLRPRCVELERFGLPLFLCRKHQLDSNQTAVSGSRNRHGSVIEWGFAILEKCLCAKIHNLPVMYCIK